MLPGLSVLHWVLLATIAGLVGLAALLLVRLQRANHTARQLENDKATATEALARSQEQYVALTDALSEVQQDSANLALEASTLREELEVNRQHLEIAEQAVADANRTKSLFVANMSHELRTPLNGILGLTRSLLDSNLNPRQQSEVELIQLAGEDLIRIVNDILDLSKLDASKLSLESIPFHVGELLEGVFSLLYPQAARKRLCYALSYSPSMSMRYLGDPFRLRQVVLNLLSNAIKFTPAGHVFLHAREAARDGTNSWLLLSFEDSGIGIGADKQRLIFDEFQQADPSTTRRFGGTGLGLSLSRRIIDLMGGEIAVDSEPGRGATFRVSIPMQPVSVREEDGSDGREDAAAMLEGIRLLVQQRHSSETLAFLRTLESVPGLALERFEDGSGLVERLQRVEEPNIDAIVSSSGAIAVWDEHPVKLLARMGQTAPPVIVLRDAHEPSGLQRHQVLHTIDMDSPVLPSQMFALLKQLRHTPLGPLFEAAGMTAFDLYPGIGTQRLRNGVVLLANDNPVELLRLEGLAKKLGLDARSSTNTRELSLAITNQTVSAAIIQASLLTTEAQVALWRVSSAKRPPMRLVVTGTIDPVTRSQLSASAVSYAILPESPRLAQLRDALTSVGNILSRDSSGHGEGDTPD